MKFKYILLTSLVLGLLQFTFTTTSNAFSVLLPDDPCTPPLPYTAEADHYSGPACIQMIFNACPNVAARHHNAQGDIYSSILTHNAEPTTWFSDPSGVEGALEDPIFSPCGNWVNYSNTDKNYVLGKTLYYMNTQRYLTPVSIGASEHWVAVIGYQTDVVPPYSGPVTLQNVFFYDPLPGNPSNGFVSGTTWLSSSDYWGVPLSKPGSAWHNKYIAIIEPPGAIPHVVIPEWILKGPILPVERIEGYFYRWLGEVRKEEFARGPFEILQKDIRVKKPILVKAPGHSYYLISFEDLRLAAVFNAYNGSFEEFRHFKQPQRYVLDPQAINSRLGETLRAYKAEIVRASTPQLRYDPKLSLVGRFSPVWEVQATVRDASGKDYERPISLNSAGQVIRGLADLERAPRLERQKSER